jgi:hypothetical protein
MRLAGAILGTLLLTAGAADARAQARVPSRGVAGVPSQQFRAASPQAPRALNSPRNRFASHRPRRDFHSFHFGHRRIFSGPLFYSSGSFPFGHSRFFSPYGYAAPFAFYDYTDYRSADYFPYLYFYDRYYEEALSTREAADRYDAEFRREEYGGTVKSPDSPHSNPAAFHNDAPLAPHQVLITLNGQPQPRATNGAPLVLGSGRHTLVISALEPAPVFPSE